MSRTIQLRRRELIWETRCITWTEEDYKKMLESLKGFKEQATETSSNWHKRCAQEYDLLSQYTWDQVCDIIQGKVEDPEIRIKYRDDDCGYTEFLSSIVNDWMREDCYDAPVTDTDYADDFYEETYVDDLEDKDASEDEAND